MKYLSSNVVTNIDNNGKKSTIIYCLPVIEYSNNPSDLYVEFYGNVASEFQDYDVTLFTYLTNDPELSQDFYDISQAIAASMVGSIDDGGGEVIKWFIMKIKNLFLFIFI